MNWNFIVNPNTGRKVKIDGKKGKEVLNSYLNIQNGGATSDFLPEAVNIGNETQYTFHINNYIYRDEKELEQAIKHYNEVLTEEEQTAYLDMHRYGTPDTYEITDSSVKMKLTTNRVYTILLNLPYGNVGSGTGGISLDSEYIMKFEEAIFLGEDNSGSGFKRPVFRVPGSYDEIGFNFGREDEDEVVMNYYLNLDKVYGSIINPDNADELNLNIVNLGRNDIEYRDKNPWWGMEGMKYFGPGESDGPSMRIEKFTSDFCSMIVNNRRTNN